MNTPGCILVIPCYNEAHRFHSPEFRAFLSHRPDTSFLFVNDGSTDDTLALLKRLQAETPDRVDILDLPRNSGKAEAVRRGLLHALQTPGLSYTGFWDADLATPLNAVHDLLGILCNDPEVQMVFGSRVKLLGRHIERRALRHYLGRVFATCASMVLRLPIYDTQCGAKLFRVTPDLTTVLQQPFCSRWIFDVELIARFLNLYAYGSRPRDLRPAIYEFPLQQWTDIPGSKVGPTDFLTAIRDLVVIHHRYLRGLRA
jgi:glycosyltransferase involved in cell wall biosynthesis